MGSVCSRVCCITKLSNSGDHTADEADIHSSYLQASVSAVPASEIRAVNRESCLADFPTELLFKIFSYLPTRDKFMIRYVCQRFRDISRMPFLHQDFVWPDYEPCHVPGVSEVLEAYGKQVRDILFPAHVRAMHIIKMASYCTNAVRLSLSRCIEPKDPNYCLSLKQLEKILHEMTNLQHLDLYADGDFVNYLDLGGVSSLFDTFASIELPKVSIEKLLEVTTTCGVRELTLRVYHNIEGIVESIKTWVFKGHSLPSTVNIFAMHMPRGLFLFWSNSRQQSLLSFEIGLYDYKKIPMNLYTSMPLRKFLFGRPMAKPPFIQLGDYGIVGLKKDIFYISEYDYYGTVRYTITPVGSLISRINDEHFRYNTNLCSVSYVDLSCMNIQSYQLEQLASTCRNLQRLNLKENIKCLENLQGLLTIINTCQNLEGLNLAGISVSSVTSVLLLWELLSSLKKLSHLAIDLCLLNLHDPNKEKLVTFFKGCYSLKALEIHSDWTGKCVGCRDKTHFLFSYFPSLAHCRMLNFQYSACTYVLNNCCQLKYLYEECLHEHEPRVLSHCNLQQLYIKSLSFILSDELVEGLSAHGKLECVILHVHQITINAITTLIDSSPNLTLLHISTKKPLFDGDLDRPCAYTQRIRHMLSSSHRKLFSIGSFEVEYIPSKSTYNPIDLYSTDLNSLWPFCS